MFEQFVLIHYCSNSTLMETAAGKQFQDLTGTVAFTVCGVQYSVIIIDIIINMS